MSSFYDPKQSPKHCVWPQQKFPHQWHHRPLHQTSVFRLCLFLFQIWHWLASRPKPVGFKLQLSLKRNWRVETVPTTSGLDQKLAFPKRLFAKSKQMLFLWIQSHRLHTLFAETDLSPPIKREQDDAKAMAFELEVRDRVLDDDLIDLTWAQSFLQHKN